MQWLPIQHHSAAIVPGKQNVHAANHKHLPVQSWIPIPNKFLPQKACVYRGHRDVGQLADNSVSDSVMVDVLVMDSSKGLMVDDLATATQREEEAELGIGP